MDLWPLFSGRARSLKRGRLARRGDTFRNPNRPVAHWTTKSFPEQRGKAPGETHARGTLRSPGGPSQWGKTVADHVRHRLSKAELDRSAESFSAEKFIITLTYRSIYKRYDKFTYKRLCYQNEDQYTQFATFYLLSPPPTPPSKPEKHFENRHRD